MEPKKSPKADSNPKRGIYPEVGLIFVLCAVAVPFFATPKERCIERIGNIPTVVEERIVETARQDRTQPEALEKVEIKTVADTLSTAKNDAKGTAEAVQADEAKEEKVADDEPLIDVEQFPTFQGGDLNTFRNWVMRNVIYPQIAQENGISGKVVVNFVIERDGSLTNIKVLFTPDKSLSDEVIRVLKLSPKWTPGRQGGKTVRVSYNLPVDFKFQKDDAKVTAGTVQAAEAKEAKEEAVVDDKPFVYVEQMPTFQGGDLNMFRRWVQMNVRYPEIAQENGISGKVVVNFVIERDGSLTNIKVLYTPDKSLSDEVIRILKQSPKWTPGRQGDKIVRVSYNLPVDFRVSSPLTVVEGQVVETSRQDQTPSEAPENVEMKAAAGTPSVVNNDAKATAETVEAKEEKVVDDEPFVYVEQMPTFQGGDLNMFRRWVLKNLRYPQVAMEKGIAGRVVLSFVIERDGSLTNIKVLNSPHKSLSEEGIRLLKLSPKWIPGRQGGNTVRVTYNLPIDFRLWAPPTTPENVEMKVAAGTPSVVNNDAKATAETVEAKEEKVADDEPSIHVEQMPTFQGGDLNTFRNWVAMNLRYPQVAWENGITGKVIVNFVIERDGSLTNIKVLYSPHKSLSDEVIRVVKQSPKWTPGYVDGKTVRVNYNVPIDFCIQR